MSSGASCVYTSHRTIGFIILFVYVCCILYREIM